MDGTSELQRYGSRHYVGGKFVEGAGGRDEKLAV